MQIEEKLRQTQALHLWTYRKKPSILWPKQIIFTGKAVNSGMSGIALKFLLLKERHPFIYHHGFPWVLAVFENNLLAKRLMLLRSCRHQQVESLLVGPENILCAWTTMGGGKRCGQRGINTAGFNIRAKIGILLFIVVPALGIGWNTWRAPMGLEACVGPACRLGASLPFVSLWQHLLTSPSFQHTRFSLIVKVPLLAKGSTSSLTCKNNSEFKLQL